MSDSREQFERYMKKIGNGGYLAMNEDGIYMSYDINKSWKDFTAGVVASRAQPERKLTDAEANALLVRMASHVDAWAESRETEPTQEECSGEALRFILAAQPAAATVPIPKTSKAPCRNCLDTGIEHGVYGNTKCKFCDAARAAQAQDDGEKQ